MAVGEVIGSGVPDGTTVGLSPTEKISFYGVTPVVQAAKIATVGTDIATLIVAMTAVRTALENIGITASA
jgi:hypothetical protein